MHGACPPSCCWAFHSNISPTSGLQLTKRLWVAAANTIKNVQLSGTVDLDELDGKVEATMKACEQSGGPASKSEDEDADFDIADVLGKALVLITQV